MKHLLKVSVLALGVSAAASFTISAQAADPCEVYLCMAGKAMGASGGSACHGPEKEFSKIKFHHGHPSVSRTYKNRRNILGSCSAADPSIVAKILLKFGRSLSL